MKSLKAVVREVTAAGLIVISAGMIVSDILSDVWGVVRRKEVSRSLILLWALTMIGFGVGRLFGAGWALVVVGGLVWLDGWLEAWKKG